MFPKPDSASDIEIGHARAVVGASSVSLARMRSYAPRPNVPRWRAPLAALLLLVAACAAKPARAQLLGVRIEVTSVAPPRVRVEGRRAVGSTAWSFRNSYAGILGLAERVEKLSLQDESGAEVAAVKRAPGEYETARPATRFRYEVRLEPPSTQTHAAHVSWLTPERGMLMLGDLLPLPTGGAAVGVELPGGWTMASGYPLSADVQYHLRDAEQAVFMIARDLRTGRGRVGSTTYAYGVSGAWAFTDGELAESVVELLKEYGEMFGGMLPLRSPTVLISPFPGAAAPQAWSAETRGATVTVISGALPSKVAASTQLGGVLSHELLHLWVPNGLALDGDYDWFYEGFTLYLALRARMRQGQLSFQDYLNALGRAYDGYAAARGADELSLVELSRRRWTGNSALVYNKGMLVAFLYDLQLMRQTGGKNSLEDVYRALFRSHGEESDRTDANAAVVGVLGGNAGMSEFVRRHVESPVRIDLAASLAPFGLRTESIGNRTRVYTAESQNKEQRELLRKLGYNEKSDADVRRLHDKFKKRSP